MRGCVEMANFAAPADGVEGSCWSSLYAAARTESRTGEEEWGMHGTRWSEGEMTRTLEGRVLCSYLGMLYVQHLARAQMAPLGALSIARGCCEHRKERARNKTTVSLSKRAEFQSRPGYPVDASADPAPTLRHLSSSLHLLLATTVHRDHCYETALSSDDTHRCPRTPAPASPFCSSVAS